MNTALRGTLLRPGPMSMPHAVRSLPSIANSIGPVTRRLPLRSSKILFQLALRRVHIGRRFANFKL